MENLQFLTNQTIVALLSVGLQPRGANTTIAKMKEEDVDKYNRMNEKIITKEKKDDHVGRPKQQRKWNEDERQEGNNSQEDQNKKEQEVQDMLREIITTM